MSTADEYLKELKQAEVSHGQVKLRTLVAKYNVSLVRLPRYKQELETQLTLGEGVDFQVLAEALEPSLTQATEFLMALDLAPVEYPDQPDLVQFGQNLTTLMTSQTVTALSSKFQQRSVTGHQERVARIANEQKSREAYEKAQQKEQIQVQAAKERRSTLERFGYLEHCDGTVTDHKTKLMWKSCAEGQSGADYKHTVFHCNWDTAMRIPQNLNLRGGFAGHDDWRLPSIEELKTLVFPGQRPAICLDAFPNTLREWFWSSSGGGASFAWSVDFDDGNVYDILPYDSFAVHLVRASQ